MLERVEVFFRRKMPEAPKKLVLREWMAGLCQVRWMMQDDGQLYIVEAGPMESKREAEEKAQGDYIIADDDCLIIGRDFVEKGMALLSKHKRFGILGATSLSDGHFAAGVATNANEVEEASAAGGVVFVRRGVLKEFADCLSDQVDDVIAQEVRRAGLDVGVMPFVKFNHVGAGYSITSRSEDNWKA